MSIKSLKIWILVSCCAIIYLFVEVYFMVIAEKEAALNPIEIELSSRDDFSENTIPDFQFVNQYGEPVNQSDFKRKIYVADFFFTSCPSICPVMTRNKLRIQETFKAHPEVLILSHSIDTRSDSIPRLRAYSERVGALRNKWHLVTGERERIYQIAKDYYVTAQQNDLMDGSFIHDGSFILIDGNSRIRGIYDGTDLTSTKVLIKDIETLLKR